MTQHAKPRLCRYNETKRTSSTKLTAGFSVSKEWIPGPFLNETLPLRETRVSFPADPYPPASDCRERYLNETWFSLKQAH